MKIESVVRDPRAVPFPLVFGAVGIFCAAAAVILLSLPEAMLPIPLGCPFLALTGLPCPTCRGTRALAALAGGDLSRALLLNPLVATTALGAGAAAAASLWRRWTHRPALRCLLSHREEILLRSGVATALAVNWIYLMLGR